jgi:hypothetical protein
MVTWDCPDLSYQRTASTITSGDKRTHEAGVCSLTPPFDSGASIFQVARQSGCGLILRGRQLLLLKDVR